MTRRARALVLAAATLFVLVAPAAGASAYSLCTRVWLASVHERICVPVP